MLLKFATLVSSGVCGWVCVFGWVSLARFRYDKISHYFVALLPFVATPLAIAHASFDGYSWDKVGWLIVAACSYVPALFVLGGMPDKNERWDMPAINLTQVFLFGIIAHACIKKPIAQFLFIFAGAVVSVVFVYLWRWLFCNKRG